jgi:hypothetical protein
VVTEIFAHGPMVVVARVVVLALALLILVACAYAIVSIIVRMSRHEWLQRAGGFEPELTRRAGELDAIFEVAYDLGPDGLDLPTDQEGALRDQ